MAKGNIYQGMGHGSIGDTVLSRLNGIQVSRIRNRIPRNPRTAKQLYQRAVMATVMRAYTAGSEIFDHSFERYTRGAQCQHRFFHRNCSQLRSLLAADLDAGGIIGAQRTMFGAPGINSPTPSPYIISEGSLPEGILQCTAGGSSDYGTFNAYGADLPEIPEGSTETYAQVAADFIDAGFWRADDIFTLCYFAEDFTSLPEFEVRGYNTGFTKQYPGGFGYVRIAFNENVLDNNNICPPNFYVIGDGSNGSAGGFFKVTGYAGYESSIVATKIATMRYNDALSLNDLMQPSGWISEIYGGFIGVIRSRKDTQLRSTTKMIYSAKRNNVFAPFGIVSSFILQAWQQGTETIGVSDAILES